MIMFPGFTFEALQHLKHFKGEITLLQTKQMTITRGSR
jgi:hypothetical protein